ncbi:hypothetical protein ACI78V_18760 [Geodermatophilus sp. SYSU D00742]
MPTAGDPATPSGKCSGRSLRFPPLTFLDEGEDVVVGRPDTDLYVVLPVDGAALLRRLRDGADPAEAAAWYAREYGEPVDLDDFVASLGELGLLADGPGPDADGAAAGPGAGGSPGTVRFQRLGAALFSPLAWLAYLAVVLAGVAAVVADPDLAPRHEHVFFSDSLVVVELSLFALQFPLVLVHELAHVLAGRRLGLSTSLRVSRRLYFLVFETVMNGLVSVPRSRRYLPMLAGMLADLVLAAALTGGAWLLRGPVADVGWLSGLCLALALTTLLRIAWQLYFFLRTDVYFLVTTVLGCVDLHGVTRQYLANAVNRRLGRTDRLVPEDGWHPRDRRAARWYAPLVVCGYALALGLLVVVALPIAWTFLSEAFGRVFLGEASSAGRFWDSALLLLLNGAQLGAAAFLAVRERRRTAYRGRHRAPRGRRARAHRADRAAPARRRAPVSPSVPTAPALEST